MRRILRLVSEFSAVAGAINHSDLPHTRGVNLDYGGDARATSVLYKLSPPRRWRRPPTFYLRRLERGASPSDRSMTRAGSGGSGSENPAASMCDVRCFKFFSARGLRRLAIPSFHA